MLKTYSKAQMILGGDCNIIIDPLLDCFSSRLKIKSQYTEIKNQIQEIDIVPSVFSDHKIK